MLTSHISILRNAFAEAKRAQPFEIDAIVVLPDHVHCIWTLPTADSDFSARWQIIKAYFSRRVGDGEVRSSSRVARRERGIWQRRFWEHCIRDDADYAAHIDYIHFNPVKHGHAATAADWPHSSFYRFVRSGVYPLNWASEAAITATIGEP